MEARIAAADLDDRLLARRIEANDRHAPLIRHAVADDRRAPLGRGVGVVVAGTDRDEQAVIVHLEHALRCAAAPREAARGNARTRCRTSCQILAGAAIRDRRRANAAAIELGDVMARRDRR